MDLLQLSILRAGGVYVDSKAVGEWERLRHSPAPRRAPAKAKQSRPGWLRQGLSELFLSLGGGFSGLGKKLQERAAQSAPKAPLNGCGATSAVAH